MKSENGKLATASSFSGFAPRRSALAVSGGTRIACLALLLLLPLGCDKGSNPEPPPAATVEEQPVTREPAPPSIEQEPTISESLATELVERWLDAQNDGDFDAYSALYAERLVGLKRVGDKTTEYDRAAWLEDRKRMFRKPMAVAASDLRVVPKGHGEAELRFRQRWASRSFQDVGEKVLVVQLTDAGLRIGREEMLSSEVQRLRPLFEGATEEASGKELYRQVESLMTKAKEGEPERTWIQVVTTMDYGCRCPDYVFSVFSGGADVESPYVYPLFPEGPRLPTTTDSPPTWPPTTCSDISPASPSPAKSGSVNAASIRRQWRTAKSSTSTGRCPRPSFRSTTGASIWTARLCRTSTTGSPQGRRSKPPLHANDVERRSALRNPTRRRLYRGTHCPCRHWWLFAHSPLSWQDRRQKSFWHSYPLQSPSSWQAVCAMQSPRTHW